MKMNELEEMAAQTSNNCAGHRCGSHSHSVILLAHPSMARLAKAIISSCDTGSNHTEQVTIHKSEQDKAHHTQQDKTQHTEQDKTQHHASAHQSDSSPVTWDRSVVYIEDGVHWNKFQDGFPNLFIEKVKNLAGRDVLFLASFHSSEVIFEQLSVIYEIPRYLARSFTLILPYFPTGTMERVDTEGQIATAKTLAQLLSSIPLTARGPAQVLVFDIHALQERFYFGDAVIPRLETAIPLLRRALTELPSTQRVVIVFPDEGAYKRFNSMFKDDFAIVICSKVRGVGAERIVKIKEGEVSADCHAVIVDDLVQTGGTLIECAKALKTGGAGAVSAFVTHPVFPVDSWKKFCDSSSPSVKFDNFWITDSIPHAYDISAHSPFRLLSLSTMIADTLLSYDLKHHYY